MRKSKSDISLAINTGHFNLLTTEDNFWSAGRVKQRRRCALPAHSKLEVSIVAGDLPRKHHVFHARAGADVMNDQVTLRRFVPDICDHADMILGGAHVPRHEIAGLEIFTTTCDRLRFPPACKIRFQIRNPPMVDVSVGTLQSPTCWIDRKVRL